MDIYISTLGFNDFRQNKLLIPSNVADIDNPYLIDSIYIFNINRYKQEKKNYFTVPILIMVIKKIFLIVHQYKMFLFRI